MSETHSDRECSLQRKTECAAPRRSQTSICILTTSHRDLKAILTRRGVTDPVLHREGLHVNHA